MPRSLGGLNGYFAIGKGLNKAFFLQGSPTYLRYVRNTSRNRDGYNAEREAGRIEVVKAILLNPSAGEVVPEIIGEEEETEQEVIGRYFIFATDGHLNSVKYMVPSIINPKTFDSPIQHANGLEILKHLVEHGADPTIYKSTAYSPLSIAAREGRLEEVKYLLSFPRDKKEYLYALKAAIIGQRLEVIYFLFKEGVNPRELSQAREIFYNERNIKFYEKVFCLYKIKTLRGTEGSLALNSLLKGFRQNLFRNKLILEKNGNFFICLK